MNDALPYGTRPWPQTFWDARAATNFVCGGLGAGLVVATVASGAQGPARVLPLLLGLAIVACGLASVFAELGRPLRAANVVRNPRTSWMTREALVAPLLFAAGFVAATGSEPFAVVAALLALLFVYCQGRMVQAARGIPAWRSPLTPWLMLATSLAEGAGLWLVVAAFTGVASTPVAVGLGLACVARLLLFRAYRRSVDTSISRDASRALDRTARIVVLGGTIAVIVLLVVAAPLATPLSRWALAAAGLAAAVAGVAMKAMILRRASHVQGFALPSMPVRGTSR